jgi:tetratricopeptide (TPR) repeat protein
MILFVLAAALAAVPPASTAPACPDGATADAYACRAVAANSAGNPAASAESFEQAALVAKEGTERAHMLAAAGNMWIAANQPGRAAVALDKALIGTGLQAEQRGEALLDRARAAEVQNDLKTARSRVAEAAQTISEDPFLWYFSAALAIREGNAPRAKEDINRALSLAPNDQDVLFEAGHVYQFAGETEKARDYWTRSWNANVNSKVGKAAQEALNMLPRQPADGASGPPVKPAPVKPK